MGQGNESTALKIISRAKGWNPDAVYDPKTKTYGPLIGGSEDPAVFTNQGVMAGGLVPDGTKPVGDLTPKTTFNVPDASREPVKHIQPKAGDPFPGMGI
jgi:hypothetical protein